MTPGAGADAALVERALAGDRRALGRTLTLVERGGPDADAVADAVHGRVGRAHVVGVTGAPGAGKSTLVARLVAAVARGRRPAVLAVDPSSPLAGGALLGDRIRMGDLGPDVFIRSMATRGQAGGLSLAVPGAVRVLDAAGHDPVIVETVGVGQVELDIVATADTVAVLVAPGWGDAVQADKAGLLEVADVLVVNKADRPGAADTRRDLERALDLAPHPTGDGPWWRPPVLDTVAVAGLAGPPSDGSLLGADGGVAALADVLDAHRAHLEATGELALRRLARDRQELVARAVHELAGAVTATLDDPGCDLLEQVARHDLAPAAAARALVAAVAAAQARVAPDPPRSPAGAGAPFAEEP